MQAATKGNFPSFENLVTTSAISYYFPEIKTRFGEGKKVDIKCDFSSGDTSEGGRMEGMVGTKIMIRKDNEIQYDLSCGCGVYVLTDLSASQ